MPRWDSEARCTRGYPGAHGVLNRVRLTDSCQDPTAGAPCALFARGYSLCDAHGDAGHYTIDSLPPVHCTNPVDPGSHLDRPKIWHTAGRPAGIRAVGGDVIHVSSAGAYRGEGTVLRSPLKLTCRTPDRLRWLVLCIALSLDGALFLSIKFGGLEAWLMVLSLLAFGGFMTYAAAMAFFGRLTIVVSAQSVSVRQFLFQSGKKVARDLPAQALTHLYVEKAQRHEGTINETEIWRPVYNVTAVLATGTHERLVSELQDEALARFIEDAIEEYLGIPKMQIIGVPTTD